LSFFFSLFCILSLFLSFSLRSLSVCRV
jgi:hypothetical protein